MKYKVELRIASLRGIKFNFSWLFFKNCPGTFKNELLYLSNFNSFSNLISEVFKLIILESFSNSDNIDLNSKYLPLNQDAFRNIVLPIFISFI